MQNKLKQLIKRWKAHEIFGLILILLLGAVVIMQQRDIVAITQSNTELKSQMSTYNEKIEILDDQLTQLIEENKRLDQENSAAYSQAIAFYIEALKRLNSDLVTQVQIIEQGIPLNHLMRFYLIDDMGEKYLDHFGLPSDSENTETILEELCRYLKNHYFEHGVINLKGIRTTDGITIATINLIEPSASEEVGWLSQYFQGSAGGYFTETVLIEGFLQREIDKWPIDAVEFLYEGKTIQMDHVPNLEFVQYRQ